MSKIKQTQAKTKGIGRCIAPFIGGWVLLRNRTLLAVSLTVFAAYTGIGMVNTVRVLYAESRGASLALISVMASAYLISNFVFQYPVGWLADRWGRKQVMVVGLLVQAVLSATYLSVTDPIAFVVLRFFEGMAAAGILPSARALLSDAVPMEQQGAAYGIFGAFFNAGFLLGPGIGGLLATTGYTSAFIGAVLFRLMAVVLVLGMIHTTNQRGIGTEKSITGVPYRTLFTLPLIGAYLVAFGNYLYLGFEITLMPLWMHDHLGASVAVIGFAYMAWAVSVALLSPVGGRVADRWHRSWLILIFGLAQAPIYLAYGLANTAMIIVALYAAHGAVYAFIQPATDAHVASSSASYARARVQGLYATASSIGAFVGASGFTPFYTINFRLPLFVMGIVCVFCTIMASALIRLHDS